MARNGITVRLVYNRLPELARRMPRAAMEVVAETLKDIDATVKAGMAASGSPSAPGQMPGIDTGALVNSLQTELQRNDMKGVYYTNTEYAPYLEYGTARGLLPRPFMTPAAERNRGKFMSKMRDLESRLE